MTDLPEPALNLPHGRYEGLCKTSTPSVPFFTATHMREYRNAALEEAARVCEHGVLGHGECADSIRALKEQK